MLAKRNIRRMCVHQHDSYKECIAPAELSSVNPARSISQAVFVGGWALEQLWLFILAPVVGAILAGVVYKFVMEKN